MLAEESRYRVQHRADRPSILGCDSGREEGGGKEDSQCAMKCERDNHRFTDVVEGIREKRCSTYADVKAYAGQDDRYQKGPRSKPCLQKEEECAANEQEN